MNQFDLIIFDFDGTWCDTRPSMIHCLKQTLQRAKLPVPAEAFISQTVGLGISLSKTFINLAPELAQDPDRVQSLVGIYRTIYLEEGGQHFVVFDGLTETLTELSQRKITCVLVSSKGIKALNHFLKEFSLADRLSMVIGDGSGLPVKPDPAVVEFVLAQFPDADKHRTLIVGDTEADIQLAKNAGVRSCWATYGYGDHDRCTALAPDYQIDRITGVLTLL